MNSSQQTQQKNSNLIVVVDDERLLRQLVAEIFIDEGYRVLQAANAKEALALLESHDDVRLVFSDIQMPGKPDGLGLLEIIHKRWPHVLLMVTSGRLRPRSEDLPDDTRFIQKPFSYSKMRQELADLLSKHPNYLS